MPVHDTFLPVAGTPRRLPLVSAGEVPADHDLLAFGYLFLDPQRRIRKGGPETGQHVSELPAAADDLGYCGIPDDE